MSNPARCNAQLPSASNSRVSDNAGWLARQRSAIAACGQRSSTTTADAHAPSPPVFSHAHGMRMWDVEGREYLDLTCGYSANNFGHAYPPLLETLQAASTQLGHLTGEAHLGKITLAEELIKLCSTPPSTSGNGVAAHLTFKALFNTSGSRAMETAWKAAISYRPGRLLSLAPAFHGRSLATSPLSHTPRTQLSLPAETFELRAGGEYPYCARCPMQSDVVPRFPDCRLACSQSLLAHLEQAADSISALVVEPAIAARGYLFPPAEFFQLLRERTQQLGILLIADEVQTGIGRCGSWLLSHRQGWQADLIVLGKSLGGGLLPISAVVGRAEVLDAIPVGAESETFSAPPIACRVAMQVLELLSDGQLYHRSNHIGQTLREWFSRHPQRQSLGILRVEGEGACCALEFSDQPHYRSPPTHEQLHACKRLADWMQAHGLLIHHTGPEPTRIVLLPPLTIDDNDLRQILNRTSTLVEHRV